MLLNQKPRKKSYKKLIIFVLIILTIGGIWLAFFKKGSFIIDKTNLATGALSALEKVAQFLPIEKDTKKELEVINQLVQAMTQTDNITRTYLVLLQNNMELRPGGGFLGQYAVLKIKNGKVESLFFEDANLLDRRIQAKVSPPYPFTRMMQIKRWKLRDSNFSPDFQINAEKAKYFMRLAGTRTDYDGVFAVNASVLNRVLALTGPITVPGYPGEYNSDNAVLKLEEQVEKAYIANPKIDSSNRKAIMKQFAPILVGKLVSLENIGKVSNFVLEELRNKDVMLSFKDPALQKAVDEVRWSGVVAQDWPADYLMLVDANMGALKTDYYIKREVFYEVDLTTEKPLATMRMVYTNTATQGDWRTSDYHSYLRIYTPKGSTFLERKMVGAPVIQEELGKTVFGVIVHTLISGRTEALVKYELPSSIKDNYRLLIQKQSGVGDLPVHITIKTSSGEIKQDVILKTDLKLEFKK